MKLKVLMAVFSVSALSHAAVAAAAVSGITVRQTENHRVWQTSLNPYEPLEWPWTASADSAEICATNELTGAVACETVLRGDGEARGSWALPAYDGVDDEVFTVVLVQKAGETVLSSESARVARTPGVEGTPVTVRSTKRGRWSKPTPKVVFSYDSGWFGAPEGESAVAVSAPGVAAVTNSLDGASGWDVAALPNGVPTKLELFFGGRVYAAGESRYPLPGALIIFR